MMMTCMVSTHVFLPRINIPVLPNITDEFISMAIRDQAFHRELPPATLMGLLNLARLLQRVLPSSGRIS